MKRSSLILTLVAGTLVFLCVLVLYLPASWFASRLPPQMRCAELGGSIWQGECLGLTVQGNPIGDLTWNLAPLKAITGRLAGDVDVRGGALIARSNLDLGFDGAGELTGLDARVPLDPAFLKQFHRNQRGMVSAQFARVVLFGLAAWLLLAETAPTWKAATLDGQAVSGAITALTNEQLTLQTEAGVVNLPLNQLLGMLPGGTAAPEAVATLDCTAPVMSIQPLL